MKVQSIQSVDIYCYRHGETDWNRAGRLQGAADIPLNGLGQKQADALHSFFNSNQFLESLSESLLGSVKKDSQEVPREILVAGAVSSPLGRARETAARALGLTTQEVSKIRIDARWSETHLGQAEGLTREELVARFGQESWLQWIGLGEESWLAKFPGGESKGEVRDRALQALTALVQETHLNPLAPKVWTVATHGGLLRRLLHHFHPSESAPIDVVNGAVFKFSFDRDHWTVPTSPVFKPQAADFS